MEPILFFTCGKVIGHLWDKYYLLNQQINPDTKITYSAKEVMDKLNIKRTCCRRMFLTNSNVANQVADYEQTHTNLSNNKYIKIHNQYVDKSKRVYQAR